MILPQRGVSDFLDSPWEALPSEEWMVGGVGGRWGEREEGREWEPRLVCKVRKDSFKKINIKN